MNRFWLKISCIAALILAVVVTIGVCVFWPAKTKPITDTKPIVESKDIRQIFKEDERDLQPQPKMPRYDRQMSGRPPDIAQTKPLEWGRKEYYFTDRDMGVRYPDSLQPKKSIPLLRNPPAWNREQYRVAGEGMGLQHPDSSDREKAGGPQYRPPQWDYERNVAADREMHLWFLDSLKAKKSVERTRPELPEGAELKLSEEQLEEMHEEALLHILEQYKDNPKQAEKIREILLERLKYHKEKRNAADEVKKTSSD